MFMSPFAMYRKVSLRIWLTSQNFKLMIIGIDWGISSLLSIGKLFHWRSRKYFNQKNTKFVSNFGFKSKRETVNEKKSLLWYTIQGVGDYAKPLNAIDYIIKRYFIFNESGNEIWNDVFCHYLRSDSAVPEIISF